MSHNGIMTNAAHNEAIWHQTKEELQLTLTKATYNTLLSAAHFQRAEGDELIINVPSPFDKIRLENHLRTKINQMASTVAGRPVTVRYEVEGEEASDQDQGSTRASSETTPTTPAAPQQPPSDADPPTPPHQPDPPFNGFQPYDSNFVMVPWQFFREIVPAGPPVVVAFVAAVIAETIGVILDWRTLERREWWEARNREVARAAGISAGSVPKAVYLARLRGYVIKSEGENGPKYRIRQAGEPVDNPVE